ncbi:hypothetical protein HBN50_05960 [Halobacteriovorax sp. GB3]|uniref:hypothetical protein n=1 Tax=Halobacteriovorax sp. GB3 TaxID=2719615 RepID=UPI0023619774|nr:hypothetical protein [Halobacteriovorax sp. GB3]MDD0852631.1 hypothetical protein [Halobacteriovorax sp. GB3]
MKRIAAITLTLNLFFTTAFAQLAQPPFRYVDQPSEVKTISSEPEALAEDDLINGSEDVLAFHDAYIAFGKNCLDKEGKELAPNVFIDAKVEACSAEADALAKMYEDLQEKADFEDDKLVSLANCSSKKGFKTIEDLIAGVSNASSKVSCTETRDENTCFSDLGCNVARSVFKVTDNANWMLKKLGGKLKSKIIDSGYADQSCFNNSEGDCMSDLVNAFAGSLIGTGKSLWSLVKKSFNFFGDVATGEALDNVSNNLHKAMDQSSKSVTSFTNDPFAWIKNKIMSGIKSIKTWVKASVFCQKWEGMPYNSNCSEPLEQFECLDCNDSLNAVCGAVGVLGSEMIVMALTGGAGTALGVGAKLTAKYASSAFKVKARISAMTPELKFLKGKKKADAKASKLKGSLNKSNAFLAAFSKVKAKAIEKSLGLFSPEKIALAKASYEKAKRAKRIAAINSKKAGQVVAQKAAKAVEVAVNTATKAKEVVDTVKNATGVKWVEDKLENSYNKGQKLTEAALYFGTGKKVRLRNSGKGDIVQIKLDEDGSLSKITINMEKANKVGQVSAKVVHARRLYRSATKTNARVKSDTFMDHIKDQAETLKESVTGSGNHGHQTAKSKSEPTAPSQSKQNEHHQKEENTNGSGALGVRQLARLGKYEKNLDPRIAGNVPLPVKAAIKRRIPSKTSTKKKMALGAVVAADVSNKINEKNKEMKNDLFSNSFADENIEDEVNHVLESSSKVNFSKLAKNERSLETVKEALNVSGSNIDHQVLSDRVSKAAEAFSEGNRDKFVSAISKKTGVSSKMANEIFEERKQEVLAAKDYLSNYKNDLSNTIKSAVRDREDASRKKSNDQMIANLEQKRRDLEKKIESAQSDLSGSSNKRVAAKKTEVERSQKEAQTPSRSIASVAPSKSSGSSTRNAVAPRQSFSSGSSASSGISAPAPTSAESFSDVSFVDEGRSNNLEKNKDLSNFAKESDTELADASESSTLAVSSKDEEIRPKASRAKKLDKILDFKMKKDLASGVEIPWSMNDIAAVKGEPLLKEKLSQLISKQEKVKRIEKQEGKGYVLHIIELMNGDKITVKESSGSMEIMDMASSLELDNKLVKN